MRIFPEPLIPGILILDKQRIHFIPEVIKFLFQPSTLRIIIPDILKAFLDAPLELLHELPLLQRLCIIQIPIPIHRLESFLETDQFFTDRILKTLFFLSKTIYIKPKKPTY